MLEHLLFGAAYYEEYLPCDRLEQDMALMAEAGINTIRIAESTWSVEEPSPGQYDFSHIDRVLEAARRWGIQVIIGTPTYAVPKWLADLDPDVLAVTENGKNTFGPRQNMDITNPTYLQYAQGIIRALVSHTAAHPSVIGFQLDNETKHYHVASASVLNRFRRWMAQRYGDVAEMNHALGLNYWSNSVTDFDMLPDPTGTVNASYAGEFSTFQRMLAEEFLSWQAEIVREYLRPDQFITHNFDFAWRSFGAGQKGFSCGVQPDMNQYRGAKALDIAGTDIYCFTQDRLTGMEIAFGGDLIRPLKQDNYLVLESQAQGFPEWLPYPGQLRLMAYSHIASGAAGVLYWPWASIHNGAESYWKGLLSHDFAPNPTYREAADIGKTFKALSPHLTGLKKENRIALLVNAESLHALEHFPTDQNVCYNDVVRWLYQGLYELNLECDILYDEEPDWSGYDLLLFPALYCADDALIQRVRRFVEQGGTVLATFRSFFSDSRAKIRYVQQPYGLTDVFGMTYNQFTTPVGVYVDGGEAAAWMELLTPTTGEMIAPYTHRCWGSYAAVTRNPFGKGHAWYVGTMLPQEQLKEYLLRAASDAGITPPPLRWPLCLRSAISPEGKKLWFLLNYSSQAVTVPSPCDGVDLLTDGKFTEGQPIALKDWGAAILEQSQP